MIVEGYMDVVRLHQAGITYAVATLGTATTQEHLQKMFRLTSEVVFCFDGDRAGRQAAWRALENALPLARDGRELKFMFLPDGHDPDTLVGDGGCGRIRRTDQSRAAAVGIPGAALARAGGTWLTSTAAPSSQRSRRPLFARMPEGVYREMLADRLAAEIRMPAARLKEHLFAGRAATPGGSARPRTEDHARTCGTNRAEAQSDERRTRQFAEPGHHVGAAPPRGGAGGQGPDGTRRAWTSPGVAVLKELLEQAAADGPTQYRHAAGALAGPRGI